MTLAGCGQVTWQVSATLTRINPPNTFTYATTTISLSATSPNPGFCPGNPVPFTDSVTLQNDGCDYATGTWQNSSGENGLSLWTKPPDIPTSESTNGVGWSTQWPTIQQFRQTLQGAVSFDGRQVKEVQGFDSSDTCYYPTSPVSRYALSGGAWMVGVYATPPLYIYSNTWIDDYVGITPFAVTTYRNAGRAPCNYDAQQLMNIFTNGHNGTMYNYALGYVGEWGHRHSGVLVS